MGAHGIGPVASAIPISGTLALVGLLGVAIFAMHVAHKVAAAREPMFPDLVESALDPAAFARELAAGGTVADDAARFTDVAHQSGVNQAYALLALVNTDAPAAPPVTTSARGYEPDPFAGLVDLTATATVDDTPVASPGAVDDKGRGDTAQVHTGVNMHPDDTLLPARRTPFRRGHAA
jgi:hypothetical protein